MMTKVEKDAAFTIVCILFQVVCALSVTGDYFNGSGMKICEVEWWWIDWLRALWLPGEIGDWNEVWLGKGSRLRSRVFVVVVVKVNVWAPAAVQSELWKGGSYRWVITRQGDVIMNDIRRHEVDRVVPATDNDEVEGTLYEGWCVVHFCVASWVWIHLWSPGHATARMMTERRSMRLFFFS